MRIRLKRLILGSGTAVTRGSGAVVDAKHATIWYEHGFVWVKPNGTKEDLRMYHPAGCEMYPADDEEAVPLLPTATKLAAVAGSKGK